MYSDNFAQLRSLKVTASKQMEEEQGERTGRMAEATNKKKSHFCDLRKKISLRPDFPAPPKFIFFQ